MSYEVFGEPDEPSNWFQELDEAEAGTFCHVCSSPADYQDDEQAWCADCAGEHDLEVQFNES